MIFMQACRVLCLLQEFYRVLEAASTRQQLTRACVRHALQQLPHGFDALDTCLLYHASLVNDAYDKWYRAFAQAVRVSILGSVLPVDTREDHQGVALVFQAWAPLHASVQLMSRALFALPAMLQACWEGASTPCVVCIVICKIISHCIYVCNMRCGREKSLCRAMRLPRSWRRMTKRARSQKNCTTTTL